MLDLHFAKPEGTLLAAVQTGAEQHPSLRLLAAAAAGAPTQTKVRANRTPYGWALRVTVWDEGETSTGIHAGASIVTWVLSGAAAPDDPATTEEVEAAWKAFLARHRAGPCVARGGSCIEE